jgi:hypothetical protein
MSYWETIKFVKKNGKLVLLNKAEKIKYDLFLENLKEGQVIETFMSVQEKEKTLAQLAKVHACIRLLAKESGYTFAEMKKLIKSEAGLTYPNENGEVVYKSFGDCSIEEVMLAIEACIEIGYNYNLNLA